MKVFAINGEDLSKYIEVPSYTINSQPISKDWTDANGVKHKSNIRQQIRGNFRIKCRTKDKHLEILRLFRENITAEGYTPVDLYVNNLDKVKTINAYITMNPANTMPLFGISEYEGFEVSVEER